jgi:hypothetical protein
MSDLRRFFVKEIAISSGTLESSLLFLIYVSRDLGIHKLIFEAFEKAKPNGH